VGTIEHEAGQATEILAPDERGLRRSKRRRRPSGQPPPLPRELGAAGKFWIGALVVLLLFIVVLIVFNGASDAFDRRESDFHRWIGERRTGWLNRTMLVANGLGSTAFTRTLRFGTIVALVAVRRWRHLFVLVGSILFVAWLRNKTAYYFIRPRPFDVRIIGGWEGSSFPSRPVSELAAALIGVVYTLLPRGTWRNWGKVAAPVLVWSLGAAEVYLGLNHPVDVIYGIALGGGITLVALRWLTPNSVFPVRYGRQGRAAHLDLRGRRGDAIRQGVHEQLGFTIGEIKPFGLAGSGGSTPMRLGVTEGPGPHLFGKLYAKTHLRADRWYKLGRAILYGTLEDEKAYNSVRRLVQYEDYVLLVLHDFGIPCAKTYGFVEITPEREYLLVTEFLEGGKEITEVEVDDGVIDDALATIRRMWDVGVAHRDVKPANILVRDGKILMIDPAFAEIRPSPWRQAVDLANMMVVLALQTDADRVYQRALRFFSPDEIAEAFAATRSLTMPSQSRAMLKKQRSQGRDILARFRELAPQRPPISIQRWSVQRIALTIGVAFGGFIALLLVLDNIQTGAL
jgi:membrane-associated phospholipid phosphatase/tRNA A-37 threonylcarbamoyl transferase component Bud32